MLQITRVKYDYCHVDISAHILNLVARKNILTCTKYMRMYPRLSMSSLLLCSIPKCVLMLAYLAVPRLNN